MTDCAAPLELVDAGDTMPPVTVDEARQHIGHPPEDDAYVGRLLRSATEFCEALVSGGRTYFASVTYDLRLAGWWAGVLQLPRPPLLSVTSVKYVDLNGTEQTYAASNYLVRTPLRTPGYVEWVSQFFIIRPVLNPYRVYPVTVRFVAGSAAVPERVRQAVLMVAAHHYRFRGDDDERGDTSRLDLPPAAARLLATEDFGHYG